MFTGIISDIGTIIDVRGEGVQRIRIACSYNATSLKLGESIAVSGACLTVVSHAAEGTVSVFDAELSPETLARTASRWAADSRVNLERALKVGDDLSGHFVTGHVDGLATLEHIEAQSGTHALTLTAPPSLARFIAPKGSVTLDGISLTVNEVNGARFTIMIIPHTWSHTTLSERKVGDALNMEVDLLARYLGRLLEARA